MIKETFVNDVGQTINPGDRVVVVTQGGYDKRVSVKLGTYLGKSETGLVQAKVPAQRYIWVNENEQPCSYNHPGSQLRTKQYNRITTLQRNRIYKVD